MVPGNPLMNTADVISEVVAYCPSDDFLYLASVSKAWKTAWVMPASGRRKQTSVLMASATPARTNYVLDDPSFWRAAKQQLMTDATGNQEKCDCRGCVINNNNIFYTTARAGNLFGLKMAAKKLECWNRRGSRLHDKTTTIRSSISITNTTNTTNNNNNNSMDIVRQQVPQLAAEIGNPEMLKWAVCTQGCPLSKGVFHLAASAGDLTILEWLTANGCPSGLYDVAVGAAAGGSLAALIWAKQRGHGWDRGVCSLATERGDLRMLAWAREHGCPWDKETCAKTAANCGHSAVLEWIKGQK
ncbi:unnamed protein product [Ectocarpus sp. 13 AM-2016]